MRKVIRFISQSISSYFLYSFLVYQDWKKETHQCIEDSCHLVYVDFTKKKNDQSHLKLPTRCNRFMQVLQNHLAPDWKLQHAPPYTLWRIPNRKCTNLWSDQSWSTHFRIKTCRKQSWANGHENMTNLLQAMTTMTTCPTWACFGKSSAIPGLKKSPSCNHGHRSLDRGRKFPCHLPACSIYDMASEAIPLAESSEQNALSSTQINHLGGRTCPKNGHQHGHTCRHTRGEGRHLP